MKPSESRSILYVDDEERNLDVFEAAFEDDYEVHVASSGTQALDLLRRQPVQLIITDMRMPGMTGVDLLEAIIPEYPDTVRMILTGFTDMDAVIKAINAGQVYHYVTKPWDEKQLRGVISGALAQYRASEHQRRLLSELAEEEKNEVALRTLFQRYVPEGVVEEVLGDTAAGIASTGERREVALLVADIREFTSLCSRLEPPAVPQLLNEYFGIMTDVVDIHHGAVNQFLGDAIFAVFGAPLASAEPQKNAVLAALAMVEALEVFNRHRAPELVGEEIKIGIGVHVGEVVVGHVGSSAKVEYAAIGDAVHQVWRIEEQTKETPNAVLIGDALRARVGENFELRPSGEVDLGGKAGTTKLYQVLSRRGVADG